jgi:hypothetical protein
MRRIPRAWPSLAFAFLLGACGGSGHHAPSGEASTGLTIYPSPIALEVGHSVAITVRQTRAGASEDLCSKGSEVAPTVDDLAIASADGCVIHAQGPGRTRVHVSHDGVEASADLVISSSGTPAPPEMRALWVTRFELTSAAAVRAIVAHAADANFDAILLQVRGNADAYYRSTVEPWAEGLSGTLGKDPGWDPLRVALDAAHGRGLQVHAWFNMFTGWPISACPSPGTPPAVPASAAGAPAHVLHAHPTWATQERGGAYCSSGSE